MNVTTEDHYKFLNKYAAERLHVKEGEKDEPLLMENKRRFVMFPIKFHEIWAAYKKVEASFWTAEEMDLAKDTKDFKNLDEAQKEFIGNMLAMLTSSNRITGANVIEKFSAELQNPEGKSYYGFEIMMENIYDEIYSMMVDGFFEEASNVKLFKEVNNLPEFKAKSEWVQRWIFDDDTLYAERLVAYAAKECIFFSGALATMQWVTKEKHILNAVSTAFHNISRDRSANADFSILLFAHLKHRLDSKLVERIIVEAVDIEKAQYTKTMAVENFGMQLSDVNKHIEFLADRLLTAFGNAKYFNSSNPFEFMETVCTFGKTNFFEKKLSDFTAANEAPENESKKPATKTDGSINFDDDF